mgnify:CR=1 FL=1
MSAVPNPQVIYTSSAPLPDSEVLHRVRNAGIDGVATSMFFAEWSCAAGADPADRENWYAANPGMGIRISPEWVYETEYLTMSPEGFATERLGVVLGMDGGNSELAEWASCSDADSVMTGKPAIAVDAAGHVWVGGATTSRVHTAVNWCLCAQTDSGRSLL